MYMGAGRSTIGLAGLQRLSLHLERELSGKVRLVMMKRPGGFWKIYTHTTESGRRALRKQQGHQKFFLHKELQSSFTTATASFVLLTSLAKSLDCLYDSGEERSEGARLNL